MKNNITLDEIIDRFGADVGDNFKVNEANEPYNTTDPKAVVTNMPLSEMAKNLSKTVSKMIGMPVTFKLTVKNNIINIESNDLAPKVKPKLFKRLIIKSDGGSVRPHEQDKVLCYLAQLYYRWDQYGGGSNGLNIGLFQINQEGFIIGYREDLK